MTILQHTSDRLVVRGGVRIFNETTVTLDRSAGVGRVDRTTLMVPRATEKLLLKDISEVTLIAQTDAASGSERYLPTLRLASGRVIALPPFDDKGEAERTVTEMREFVGSRRSH